MSELKFNDDDSNIIATIQDSKKTEVIEVAPGQFTTREVYRVPEKSLTSTLKVASLTGFIEYINQQIDGDTRKGLFVQVDGPTDVCAGNAVFDREDRRFWPILAKADTPNLQFDQFLPKETAMIMLQSRFVENEQQEDLLRKLGTIIATEELGQEDDGVTQNIATQRRLNRTEEAIVNPVYLRPYRTFTEIDQPESPFIVRIKKDEREGIHVALFEADGGAWRNTARRSIKNYLASAINAELNISVIA